MSSVGLLAVVPAFFLLTDIEGVAGIDSFETTRTSDETVKAPAMDQLAREVEATIDGIRSVHPDAEVDVWDGHGSGGLRGVDVEETGTTYLDAGRPYFELNHDAMLFVGQHAMAGTAFAPLRHTYSSRSVAYYKLNGTYVGEFGARALVAGRQGVPTVFLSGDDKACHEAEMFVPEIETVAVKQGTGEESARHLSQSEAVKRVREGAARAAERVGEIPPLTGIDPPYELEMRYYDPVDDDRVADLGGERVDERTVRVTGADVADPESPFGSIL
jgi:D-amino peptidase